MKFNHDAKKMEEAVEGATIEEVDEILTAIMEDPMGVLGERKSQTVEFIRDSAEEPNTLVAIASLTMIGAQTMKALEGMAGAGEDIS